MSASLSGREPGLGGVGRRDGITGREPELSGLRARARAMFAPLILHSDDEPSMLMLMSIILERAGYRVEGAVDAYATLELAESLHPDLIMTDIMKPGMSGLELLSRLKAHPSLHDIPVVMLTAYSAVEIVAQALEMGAAHYVTKPCESREILEVIASVLEGWAGESS